MPRKGDKCAVPWKKNVLFLQIILHDFFLSKRVPGYYVTCFCCKVSPLPEKGLGEGERIRGREGRWESKRALETEKQRGGRESKKER